MTISAQAPGKLVLLGEYAVLEGAPAIVMAVDRYARVQVEPSREGFTVLAPDVGVKEASGRLGMGLGFEWTTGATEAERVELGLIAACVEAVALALGKRRIVLPPALLRIDSHELRVANGVAKLGVGSSAAVAAATVTALVAHAGVDVSAGPEREALFATTLAAHQAAQGKFGSGVDVAASIYGGLLRFVRGAANCPVVTELECPDWLEPIAVWSGRAASTPAFIAAIQAFKERAAESYVSSMEGLKVAAEAGLAAIANDEPSGFLTAVDTSGALLEELGVAAGVDIFSVEHQRVRSVVRAAGGVYKPSGAGGGDLGLAFAAAPKSAADLRSALRAAGLDVVSFAFDVGGAAIGRAP